MRILGVCPSCGRLDTLHTGDDKSKLSRNMVLCIKCDIGWDDWRALVRSEGEVGRVLIPVEIKVTTLQATMPWPKVHFLPLMGEIAVIFAVAVRQKFCLAIDYDAVRNCAMLWSSSMRYGPVLFKTMPNHLGLYRLSDATDNACSRYILTWYGKLLRALCEEDLWYAGHSYGRGAVFRVSPLTPDYKSNTRYQFEVRRLALRAMSSTMGSVAGAARAYTEGIDLLQSRVYPGTGNVTSSQRQLPPSTDV